MKGKYKTKTRFIKFIGKSKRLSTDNAIIEGKYFSLDEIKFSLKLYDDGSVDFDEIETKTTTPEQRGHLLERIEDRTISIKGVDWVVNELEFTSDDKKVYLVVENERPYKKLDVLFEEEEKPKLKLTKSQKSKIEELFSMLDEVEDKEVEEEVVHEPIKEEKILESLPSNDWAKVAFEKMMLEKKSELESKLISLQSDFDKLTHEEKTVKVKIQKVQADILLLKDRLKTLGFKQEFNGFYFHISERKNDKIDLDTELEVKMKEALKKVKNIDVEAFMKLFENGEYHITIYDGEDVTPFDFKTIDLTDMSEDRSKQISKILNQFSDLSVLSYDNDGHLVYRGEKDWHGLVEFFIEKGFQHIVTKR